MPGPTFDEIETPTEDDARRVRGKLNAHGRIVDVETIFRSRSLETSKPDRSHVETNIRKLMSNIMRRRPVVWRFIGTNGFFSGHDNKLTFDVSRLMLDQPVGPRLVDSRIRVQWDISF